MNGPRRRRSRLTREGPAVSHEGSDLVAPEPERWPATQSAATGVGYGAARVASAAWSIGGRIAGQLVQVVGFVVLSHLLGPRTYGIVAVAAIFTGFSQIFTDLGIGPAIVTRRELTEGYLATAFAVNALSGAVVAALVAPCGMPLAYWFDLPALRWVVPVLSIGFVVSVSPVSVGLLERAFRFRAITAVEVGSIVVGQAIAIALAALGHGLAGLALLPVVSAATLSVAALFVAGWRPRGGINRGDFHALRSYVGPLAGFNAVTYWARNFDNLLVGKLFGAGPLAFYSRAYALVLAPVQQTNYALDRFLQAAFATERADRAALRRRHLSAAAVVSVFALTVCAVTIPIADDFVRLIFGPAWRPMGSLLAIFALSIAPQTLTGVNGSLLRATDNTKLLFRLGAINAAMYVVAISIAALWSVRAVAWAFDGVGFATVLVTFPPTARRVGLDNRAVFGSVAREAWPAGLLLVALFAIHSATSSLVLIARLAVESAAAAIGVVLIAIRTVSRWSQRTTPPDRGRIRMRGR